MATFVPHTRSKSGSTNLPEGTVHIYRDSSKVPTSDDSVASTSATQPSSIEDSEDGVLLGILAVPSWMTPSDFLTFVAPAAEGIAHLRMIR